ncbi:DUF1206 domain-containing protein [Lysinibacter sp. HNR]|uniref:DUF1206 domain-containing protein n=1 Tax=Lysinibacter sp. HNR TaxID=3031408 RepID=UPI002435AD76|nr:DUF1206 domain-containing protein [Lysinibacter sp. HNR]WGD38141.1 DUF1206 domain-containing protein [Lysinibacter sp. HNR]
MRNRSQAGMSAEPGLRMKDAARKTHGNRTVRIAARVGLIANGAVHILIGVIAFTIAQGGSGDADQAGALGAISRSPGGALLLWGAGFALGGLAVWQLTGAVWVSASGISKLWLGRLKEIAKAMGFAAMSWTTLFFTLGVHSDAERRSQEFSKMMLGTFGGVIVLFLVGAIIIAVGLGIAYRGVSQGFRVEINFPGGIRNIIIRVCGVAGHVTKGIAFVIVGGLFIAAAIFADPDQAGGLDGALKYVASLPFGYFLLTAVAFGFVMYGFYLFSRARYLRNEP